MVGRARHRGGIGRRLVGTVEHDLVASGVRMLQVKTFGPTVHDPIVKGEAQICSERGWALTEDDIIREFVGLSVQRRRPERADADRSYRSASGFGSRGAVRVPVLTRASARMSRLRQLMAGAHRR